MLENSALSRGSFRKGPQPAFASFAREMSAISSTAGLLAAYLAIFFASTYLACKYEELARTRAFIAFYSLLRSFSLAVFLAFFCGAAPPAPLLQAAFAIFYAGFFLLLQAAFPLLFRWHDATVGVRRAGCPPGRIFAARVISAVAVLLLLVGGSQLL